jgi:hypothetical protein
MLPCTTIIGSPAQIGRQLGQMARPLMADFLAHSTTWAALQGWRGHAHIEALAELTRARFPRIWQELAGLAEGLQMPLGDVFLWNCRGDVIHAAQEGCTSLAIAQAGGGWIAHNEDGDPALTGRCWLIDARPEGLPGFIAFCYPGSLPGNAFGAGRGGVAQTINNVRVPALAVGLPRMVLSRAVLDAGSLDQAVAILRENPRAGGFHHLLGGRDGSALLSVEATPAACSVLEISRSYGHSNHLLHDGSQGQAQIVTDSSQHRLDRLAELLRTMPQPPTQANLLAVLRDQQDAALPILRQSPADPDQENTLAQVIIECGVQEIRLNVFTPISSQAQTFSLAAA